MTQFTGAICIIQKWKINNVLRKKDSQIFHLINMLNDILTYLKPYFLYVKGEPIIFTQLYFWGFFAVVLALYSLVYKKNTLRTFYLLLVSFFFYYKTSGVFLILLLFTITSDYNWGRLIYKSKSYKRKKLFLTFR